MKRTLLYGLAIAALQLSFHGTAKAQNIIREWKGLGESAANIDLAYRVIQCSGNSAVEVHLQVFNEKPTADTAKFDLTVRDNASNQQFTTRITRAMAIGEMAQPDCSSNSNTNGLKITLPAAYDATAITVTAVFVP